MIVVREGRLNVNRQRAEMTLVEDRLHKLRCQIQLTKPRSTVTIRTNLFKSSLLTSGLTPTIFLSILAMESSLNITISWSKNLIRHGFVAKCTLGILALSRETNVESKGLRGRVELTVISRGPGTKIKCVARVISG